jgi:uncharacterized membrane protein
LAPAFWALNNVFIKFLITNKFKSYFPLIFTVISIDAVFAVIVLISGVVEYSFPYSLLALAVGLMPLMAFWFYSKALITEEVSRIVTLFQLIPIFVVFLSVIFLTEILGTRRYLGIGLIVIASILISYKKAGKKSFSGVLKFMVPFGIIIAVYTIADKTLLGYLDYWSVFFWNLLGTFTEPYSYWFSQSYARRLLRQFQRLEKKRCLQPLWEKGFTSSAQSVH